MRGLLRLVIDGCTFCSDVRSMVNHKRLLRIYREEKARMLICPEASSAQNNIAAVSADGRTVCVLIRRLKFLVPTLDCICVAYTAPLVRRQAREGEQAVSCPFQGFGRQRGA